MALRYLPLLTALLSVVPLAIPVAAAEPTPRIGAPATHENLAIYFVRGPSVPGSVPDTLQEALAKGTVEVRETGNVRELDLENKGELPVFVQFGDIVKGGQQDRVLTVSMVLPPHSGNVQIGAYCVEQGRWAERKGEDVRRFARADDMMPSRTAKLAMARPSAPNQNGRSRANPEVERGSHGTLEQRVQRQLPREGDGQGEVWRSVGYVQQQLSDRLKVAVQSDKSRTSLQLSLENEQLKAAHATYLAKLEPAGADDDIVGVVIAVDGRISSADLYPSNGLFRKMWPKLVRAAATEALSSPVKAEAATNPDLAAIERFLARETDIEAASRELPGGSRVATRTSPTRVDIEVTDRPGTLLHRNVIAN